MGNCIKLKCCKSKKVSKLPSATKSKISLATTVRDEETRSYTPSSVSLLGDRKVVVALYNYNGHLDDISFAKGDRMLVLDDNEKDWYFAKHFTSKHKGYVLKSYVEDVKSIAKEDWYFEKLTRGEAEKLLLDESLFLGTFLIRTTEKDEYCYCLSIRGQDSNGTPIVCHYRIKIHPEEDNIYIHHDEKFATLQDLIKYYMVNAHDLCNRLVVPCPKPEPDLPELAHRIKDNWDVNNEEFRFIKYLGSGKYGEVWLGKWLEQQDVAIKVLKQGSMSKQAFIEEARLMRLCQHENLVRLYAVCTKKEPIFMIMEYMNKGSLNKFLGGGEGSNMRLSDMVDILSQVANGMAHLESRSLIHRDLSSRNVLIKDNNRVKIADFGMARLVPAYEYSSPIGELPIKWSAIESIQEGTFTIKSDVWSFGVLAIEMFTYGAMPYADMSNSELFEALVNGYREPKPPNCPNDIYSIILQCWSLKPSNRPTFAFIREFLSNYLNFEN